MDRYLLASALVMSALITQTLAAPIDFTISEEFAWHQSDPTPTSIPIEGFCFLTGVTGDFDGGAEWVELYTSGTGWILRGDSSKTDLGAWARCVAVSPDRPFKLTELRSWEQVGPDRRAKSLGITTDEGFCFPTMIKGEFEGRGENVSVYVSENTWLLFGRSEATDVAVSAQCVTMSPNLFEVENKEHVWVQGGNSSSTGIKSSEGFCFLNDMTGKFEGGGEELHVDIIGDDWVMRGASEQKDVAGSAQCVKWKP
jgi:hypothetical protein